MKIGPSQEVALYQLRMALKALWEISQARNSDEEAIMVSAAGLSGLFEMLSMTAERIDPPQTAA